MLFLFRKNQKYLLWVLLVVVIITFIGLYGQSYLPQQPKKVIAKYKGKELNQTEVYKASQGARILRIFNNMPIDNETTLKEMESEGLMMLINVDQARAAGYAVSDVEVERVIESIIPPQALANKATYQNAIAKMTGMNMLAHEFEEHVRNVILLEKSRQYLISATLITKEEEELQYKIDNTLAKISYIPFEYKPFKATVVVSSNEVVEFFNTDPNLFIIPEKVEFIAAIISPDKKGITASAEEISDYYNSNKRLFVDTNSVNQAYLPLEKVENDIKARVIDQKAFDITNDKLTIIEFAMMDSKLDNPKSRIDAFNKKTTEEKIKVINSGLVGMNDRLPAFSFSQEINQAAFGLDIGSVSGPIQVPNLGVVLLIVKDRQDAYVPEVADCYEVVKTKIIEQRAGEQARQMAEKVEEQIKAAKGDFIAVAKKLGYKTKTSKPILRTGQLTGIQSHPKLVSYLFAFPEQYPVVFPYMNGFMVAAVTDYIPADVDLMNSSENEILQTLRYNEFSSNYRAIEFMNWNNLKFTRMAKEEKLEDFVE